MAVLSFPPIGIRIAVRHLFVLALVAAVLIAFGVMAGMAVLLPPEPAPPVRLDAIAAALRTTGDGALARSVTATAPALPNDRWIKVLPARRQLAGLLRVDPAAVRLAIASPIALRRVTMASASVAAPPPIRAAMLPFDQADAAPAPITVTSPPPIVTIAPPVAAPAAAPAAAPPAALAPDAAAVPTVGRSRRVPRRAATRPIPVPSPAPTPAPAAAAPVTAQTAPVPVVVPVPAPAPVATAPAPRSPAPIPPRQAGSVPEIRGGFIAALRLPAGGWAVVTPQPETTPTGTQQRMVIWFLVALAVSVPLAWAAAIMLVRPMRQFGADAERSGRDPALAMPAGALAELAPAAEAIGRLQGRVRGLVRDRTAFAGTVRSDLRAPLARLRARLDETPRQIREPFHDDLTDIEEAVAALQLFLSDAAAPDGMTRQALGELIRAAAARQGDGVTVDAPTVLWIAADPEAIARLLDQLFGYVRQRAEGISVRLEQDENDALVTVAPAPRSAPAGFLPGLHGKAGRATGVRGDGPGLAAARSIARGHGGEVRLVRSDSGMILCLRLPLA